MGKHKDKKKHDREKHKKTRHKEKKKKHKKRSRTSESSDSEEWVEKAVPANNDIRQQILCERGMVCETEDASGHNKEDEITSTIINDDTKQKRDEWMDLSTSFSSFSNLDRRQAREVKKESERNQQIYNPSTYNRELNPYWKDGGDGLPKFRKPTEDNYSTIEKSKSVFPSTSKGWRKKTNNDQEGRSSERANKCISKKEDSGINTESGETGIASNEVLSDKDLNKLASRLVKAEIMGNIELAKQLKEKLDEARQLKHLRPKEYVEEQEILLTHTDSKGYSRPIKEPTDESLPSGSKPKKQKVETHKDGQRIRYFADDDKYSLKQMFESEKYTSIEDQNREFIEMAGRIRKNDDLDEVFEDKIRHKSNIETLSKNKAISEHQRMSRSLDNCNRCIQSDRALKHLMVSMGETVYLSVPYHEPLTKGHCLLTPIRHVSCATQLDENEWQELLEFRKALTKMFISTGETVIFFETAMHLDRLPHMAIECIPVQQDQGDLAPIYFKKAIDESEFEWSQNKKLVSLKGRNVQKAIPKGLPYFCVSFGMEEGFAHVIEEEKYFPPNFAQEILGGMLDLDHSKWRKPRTQNFSDQSKRVIEFTQMWNKFDNTKNV